MKTKTEKPKLVILIVDDNMSFVERMVGLLDEVTDIRYINIANDYTEADRLLQLESPDVALLDINLPGKNGIELLKKIKRTCDDCKIIMITNHADDYYKEQCRELGAAHFLDKSNDFGKVPSIISGMVAVS